MTTKLWLAMLEDIMERTNITNVPFSLIKQLSKTTKANVNKFLASYG